MLKKNDFKLFHKRHKGGTKNTKILNALNFLIPLMLKKMISDYSTKSTKESLKTQKF